ncbi:TPA: hypothetical protein ACSTJY_004516 [Serratia fonticola]
MVLFHAIVLIIATASLISGLLHYQSGIGKLLILIAAVLGLCLVMVFKFDWNPPWNFWDR